MKSCENCLYGFITDTFLQCLSSAPSIIFNTKSGVSDGEILAAECEYYVPKIVECRNKECRRPVVIQSDLKGTCTRCGVMTGSKAREYQ